MKFSEAVGKNFFGMSSHIPGRTLVYYLDYQANGKSRATALLEKKGIKKWRKEIIPFGKFALIGVYIKSSDAQKFEECMDELESTAPFFCSGYKEARIQILDNIVVMKKTSE